MNTLKVSRIVAYYRVSTKRQGRSGLGLEAQQEMVRQLAAQYGATIIAEFVEVETGKIAERPQLEEAMHRARLTNSTLVIAKLDRLARNVAFLSRLMDSGLEFVCCDNPHATRFTLHILAAVAEHEAKMISDRTKAALRAAKARGVKLGSAREGHWEGREHLRDWKKANAASAVVRQSRAAARYEYLLPEIIRRREDGQTIAEIVEWLNQDGFVTPRNKPYTVAGLYQLLKRLAPEHASMQSSRILV